MPSVDPSLATKPAGRAAGFNKNKSLEMQSVLAYGSDEEGGGEATTTVQPSDDEEKARLRAQAEKFDSLVKQATKPVQTSRQVVQPRRVKPSIQDWSSKSP